MPSGCARSRADALAPRSGPIATCFGAACVHCLWRERVPGVASPCRAAASECALRRLARRCAALRRGRPTSKMPRRKPGHRKGGEDRQAHLRAPPVTDPVERPKSRRTPSPTGDSSAPSSKRSSNAPSRAPSPPRSVGGESSASSAGPAKRRRSPRPGLLDGRQPHGRASAAAGPPHRRRRLPPPLPLPPPARANARARPERGAAARDGPAQAGGSNWASAARRGAAAGTSSSEQASRCC